MYLVINSKPQQKLSIPKATKLTVHYRDGRPHILCNEEMKPVLIGIGLTEIKGIGLACDKPMELTCD